MYILATYHNVSLVLPCSDAYNAMDLTPFEVDGAKMSVFGTPEERRSFFQDVRENKLCDTEIVRRIRQAAARSPRFVPDQTLAAGMEFYRLAEEFFTPRNTVRSDISRLSESDIYSGGEFLEILY